jgi:hypothetical protein
MPVCLAICLTTGWAVLIDHLGYGSLSFCRTSRAIATGVTIHPTRFHQILAATSFRQDWLSFGQKIAEEDERQRAKTAAEKADQIGRSVLTSRLKLGQDCDVTVCIGSRSFAISKSIETCLATQNCLSIHADAANKTRYFAATPIK